MIGWAAQNGGDFADVSAQAAAARQANDIPRAIELYRQSVHLNPKWEEGWWYLGSLEYDSDQYAGGRDALRHVVELDANAAPAWALLGLCEFETGEYRPSLEHIERALAAGTVEPRMEGVLRYHEAQLLTRTGEFDKAVKAYAWFARRGVDNPELIEAVGLAALRTPLLPKEVAAAQRELYAAAGRAAYASLAGDFAAAQTALSNLVERYPEAHYVHYLYGCFLLAIKPDLAMAELKRETEVTPQSGAANAMLAWILLERGETDAARPYAAAAASQDRTLPLAQYVYGRSLLEDGKLQDSIEHLQFAEKSDPANVETHMSLATAYSKAARPADARRERLQTLALLKEDQTHANP